MPGRAVVAGDGLAHLGRVGEAAAVVRKDRRIGAEQAEQLAEQRRRRDPRRAAERRMGDEGDLGMLALQRAQRGHAADHRCEKECCHAVRARQLDLPLHLRLGAVQARRVERAASGLLVRRAHFVLAGGDPLREGRAALVGPAVVVLDDVDSRMREGAGERRHLPGRGADRLQRGAGQRPALHTGQPTQPLAAEIRPAESLRQRRRQIQVDEFDLRLQRAVAEQYVQKLAGILADRLGGEPQVGEAGAVGLRLDPLDACHHLVEHAGLADGLRRHLDALFDRQQPGTVRRLFRLDPQAIDDVDS